MQLTNTLAQIANSGSTDAAPGMYRHLCWQVRRLLHAFPVELTISASKIVVDRPTGVAALVNCMGMYDFNNMTLLRAVLQRTQGIFFDIGANIGTYTLVAAEIANATVVSVEPHPTAFGLLCDNVRRNCRNSVECMNVALSNREGTAVLSNDPELSTNRLIASSNRAAGVLVPITTLDNLCIKAGLNPTAVKIDVEGHEQEVLEGFRSCHDDALVLIVEKGEAPGIRRLLAGWGFAGPGYFHAAENAIMQRPTRRPEDPIYYRPELLDCLQIQK